MFHEHPTFTMGDLADTLIDKARKYRLECNESINRNKHMNSLKKKVKVPQAVIDAILVDFINNVYFPGDLALYTKDLHFRIRSLSRDNLWIGKERLITPCLST